MNLLHPILMIIWPLSTYQENYCRFSRDTMICEGIQQEDFLYQLYKNEDDFGHVSNIEFVNSNFSYIKSFSVPQAFSYDLRKLTFRNCSIHEIDKGAFQGLRGLELDFTGNFIKNISFIENLNLTGLNLENNKIEILDLNILVPIKNANKIILKGNQIREILPLKEFATFTTIDLSFNRINVFNESYLNCFFSSIDLSHNELEVITILDEYVEYQTFTKKLVNLKGNNITSLGPYANQSFTCDELYLTYIPTDLPEKFFVTKVFSLANTSIGSLNSYVFNMSLLQGFRRPIIDLSNAEISNISAFYLEGVNFTALNLSHNNLNKFNETIFEDSRISYLDLSFSKLSNLPNNTFQGLEYCETVNLTGNFLKTVENICNHVQFVTIDLSYNKIDRIGGESFVNCSRLRFLNISHSGITYIHPGSFADLNSLYYLDLSNNNIMNIKEDAFINLYEIQTIDLASNTLGVLETNVFHNLSVTDLIFTNTTIKYIQNKAFNNLHNLVTLNFSNTGLAFVEPNSFFNLPRLETIDLRYNDLTTIESNTFYGLSLSKLYLDGNKIKIIKTRAFENLSFHYSVLNLSSLHINLLEPFSFSGVSVRTIDLRNNNISEIREDVFSNTTATTIFLDRNNISNISAMNDNSEVKELHLTLNGILSPRAISYINLQRLFIVNSSIELMNNCFMGLFELEELYLNNSLISSFELGALNGLFHVKQFDASNLLSSTTVLEAGLFSEMSRLKSLRISNTNLSEIQEGAFTGLKKLNELYLTNISLSSVNGNIFDQLKSLTLLDLSNNSISYINVSYILNQTESLKTLRLSNNRLDSLSINGRYPELKALFLNNNRIGSLSNLTFQGLEGLETLHLQNNIIEIIGYGSFRNLSNLRELRLNGNNLYNLNVDVFGGLKSLHVLDFSDNTRLFQRETFVNTWGLKPNLQIINFDNTYTGYTGSFDYKSLKEDNPYLKKIGINYNRFSCNVLSNMIKYFIINHIDYSANNPRYDISNIDGIVCGYNG
nr:protein artichoke-like [Leptinotarsa decemlineata]